ncbi:hypothetical protein D3C83_131170 [compost metagenome]
MSNIDRIGLARNVVLRRVNGNISRAGIGRNMTFGTGLRFLAWRPGITRGRA